MKTGSWRVSTCPALLVAGMFVVSCLGACSSDPSPNKRDCSKFDGPCTRGVWQPDTGLCIAERVNEGQSCNDGDRCTRDDTCRSGVCAGVPLDCTELDDECNRGVCRAGECVADPRDDGTPCVSQTDACREGVCQDGACEGQPLPDGTACNDGDWCTQPDSCQQGTCSGPARDCDDGLACTGDVCDAERNACLHPVAEGACLIGASCHQEGDANPGNPCQTCQPDSAQNAWTDQDDLSCDDGNPCTDPDTCTDGLCSGEPVAGCCQGDTDCNDGKPCTRDLCDTDTGVCANPVIDGACLIGGACYQDGGLNPQNPCQECRPAQDQTGWTDNTRPCNDGLFCTGDDTCSGGVCQGTAGVVCDDGLDCTQDICDEEANTCDHQVLADACRIGGVCFDAGATRPANSCQACLPASSQADWTNLSDGSECDDESFCNQGESCSQGVCQGGGPRDCDDGLACTQNSCNEATDQCEADVQTGWCAVDGGCWSAGQLDPANPCQECVPAASQLAWTDDDTNSCDDGNWCTVADVCAAGTCGGSPRNCDDGISCTQDTCDPDAQQCEHPVAAGFCLVAGACFPDGELDPDNPCQECVSATDPAGWTDDDTNSCDDGNDCTGPDHCHDGTCTGDPIANCCTQDADCNDGRACTEDLCDVGTGTCSNPIAAGWCLIDNACHAEGAPDPDNPCRGCVSATSQTEWSGLADGSPCDDGAFCTVGEVCTAGVCGAGTPNGCDDGLSCTEDTCNEGNDTCDHQLLSDRCLIGDACLNDGQVDPANDCRSCQVAVDQTAWSTLADGTACGGICNWCQAGSCTAVPGSGALDPFGQCPACHVCDGDGACQPAADGTDPKDECVAGDCTRDACQQGTCNQPSGTQCDDLSPGNCRDAQCDGDGQCVQDHGPEPGGDSHLCRPADGDCDLDEYCDGTSLDCPPDQVQDSSVVCRPAADACDLADTCDGSSRYCPDDLMQPAGTQCDDATPVDCIDAQCDGLGACVQDYDLEADGTACDDGDACTIDDVCDAAGQCAGAPLVVDPDPASPLAATSACLTAGSGALSVISVQLRDTGGAPVAGATVTIEADNPAVGWTGPVQESAAATGTYFRVMRVPDTTGSASVTATAASGSGSCTSPTVDLTGSVTIQFAGPAVTGTGGCSPIDNNLRVLVVHAETGAPFEGARVMVGAAAASVFEDDYEDVLAGTGPDLPNTATTGPDGLAVFVDHGAYLEGPQVVTAGAAGHNYVTLADVDASDLVIPLTPITGPPSGSQIDGWLTGMNDTDFDGLLAAGIVAPEIGLDSLVRFRFDDLLAAEEDCWLATDHWAIGDTWVEMPVNIYVPEQQERAYGLFTIPIYEHRYKTRPVPDGSIDHRIVAISGTAPFSDVVDTMTGGGSLADIIPMLETDRLGLIVRTIDGDEHDVAIDMSTALDPNVDCTIENKPAGSDALCFTVGDWSGGTGEGSMFIMGFRGLTAGQGTVTTVDAAGDFSGIGYLGLGVAAFLDSDALPAGEEWKAHAASGRLDRSGTSFDGSGGALVFDDFLEITELIRTDRTYAWNPVDTVTPVDYTVHDIDLVSFITYTPGAECNEVEEDLWRSNYWRIYTPADTVGFTLPDLPSDWPRAADGGLATPGAGERLSWSFGAFHLGLLSSFDFDEFDFHDATRHVTHSSTNFVDF